MATGTTSIRSPTDDIGNHTIVLRQLKEVAEVGQRLRGDPLDSFVRVKELVDAGIARFTNNQIQPAGSTAGSGGTVTTALSVQGSGLSSSPIQLVNDSASPGNSMLYGTNASGVKGWYTQPSGSSSPLTTKGDVYVFGSTNTRLPVGTDGQVMTADSTQATGLKWATPSSSSGSANVTPDTHPASPTSYDDEFEFGTSIDTSGARFTGANAWVKHAAASVTASVTSVVSQGGLQSVTYTGSVSPGVGYSQAVPAGTWEFTWKAKNCAAEVYNSSTWKGYYFGWTGTSNNFTIQSETRNWDAGTYAFNATVVNFTGDGRSLYFKLKYDGTNLVFSWCQTGYSSDFVVLSTQAASAWIGTPTHFGFGSQTNEGVDWFRRTA